jgi:hypothetical protein
MSTADCWATAATMAVEELSKNGAKVLEMPLFFGRQDNLFCSGFSAASPEAEFPDPEKGLQATTDYFNRTFGFSQKETVTIIGVHSLGVARCVAQARWISHSLFFRSDVF